MPYNEKIAERIREALSMLPDVEEKKMFRGITFMVNGKMCISVGGDEIMCRIGPALHDTAIEKNGCREMVHGGKVMKGFVYVHESELKTKKQLDHWIQLSLDFNKNAKASKKRK
jgi:TfoX/Sxy family transcriptional regulator of competence genes